MYLKRDRMDRMTIWGASLFWLALIVGCGTLGLVPFVSFYTFVIGLDELRTIFDGLMPMFPLILVGVTFLEVAFQWLFRRSMMSDTKTAILVCSSLALAGGIIQYLLPVATRFDDISRLFGFDGRHPTALVCELSASSLAVIGGIFAFVLTRRVLLKLRVIY